MIGWSNPYGRDLAEVIVTGKLDDDLDRVIEVITRRKKVLSGVPPCPVCGELLENMHVHDGIKIQKTRNVEPHVPDRGPVPDALDELKDAAERARVGHLVEGGPVS